MNSVCLTRNSDKNIMLDEIAYDIRGTQQKYYVDMEVIMITKWGKFPTPSIQKENFKSKMVPSMILAAA